jgi:hypothetical protein
MCKHECCKATNARWANLFEECQWLKLQSNESLRGMLSRMSETILDILFEILEYSFPILLRLIVLVKQLYKNDSLLFFEMRVDQSKARIYSSSF